MSKQTNYRVFYNKNTGVIHYRNFAKLLSWDMRFKFANSLVEIILKKVLTKDCFNDDGLSELGVKVVDDIKTTCFDLESTINCIFTLSNVQYEVGHCFGEDSDPLINKYNLKLSKKRSESEVAILISKNGNWESPFDQTIYNNQHKFGIIFVSDQKKKAIHIPTIEEENLEAAKRSVGKTIAGMRFDGVDIFVEFTDGTSEEFQFDVER